MEKTKTNQANVFFLAVLYLLGNSLSSPCKAGVGEKNQRAYTLMRTGNMKCEPRQ